MTQLFYIEYKIPFEGDEVPDTRMSVFTGTEDDLRSFIRKEAFELMKMYEVSNIHWKTRVGNKTVCGGLHFPKVHA